MKFKNAKNKKTKLHIKFNEEDRKNYLLGFRKRKLERKEKAKEQMEEMVKKQKQEIKKKRIDFIQRMIEDRTTQFSDESDDETHDETPDHEDESVVTDYDNCTVEVSNIDLQNKGFLGNKSKKNTKPSGSKFQSKKGTKSSGSKVVSKEEEDKSKIPFKLPIINKINNKKIKTSIWKTASRKAKKSFDADKRNKKKKKVQVTQL